MPLTNLKPRLWIVLAALLWATDNLIRYPASVATADGNSIDIRVLVFAEHLIGLIIFAPFAIFRVKSDLFRVSRSALLGALFAGVVGSALGGLLFNLSLVDSGAVVPLLVQKLQPIFVVLLAMLVLKERLNFNWFPWTILAFISAAAMSLPELGESAFSGVHGKSLLQAFGAVLCWAISTVAGKWMLRTLSPEKAVFWRWIMATLAMGFVVAFGWFGPNTVAIKDVFKLVSSHEVFMPSLYLGTVAGSYAMFFYYIGLRKTPASVTTFIELLYPLMGAVFSVVFLHAPMTLLQGGAAFLLLLSVALIAIPRDS